MTQRSKFSDSIDRVKKALDDKSLDAKRKLELTALGASATLLLKAADTFIEALKASEVSDKSPLFNAGRYLAYADRTNGADVLDFDLRLEGLAITRENIFVGQRLRLSAVASLTYRLFSPDGQLKLAKTARRITRPIDVDLKGLEPTGDFWNGAPEVAASPRNSP